MHVVVLLNQVSSKPTPDELDVLIQCDAVEGALQQLGHRTTRLSCGLNLETTRDRLRQLSPDIVFNLVESFDGTDRLMPLATLLLESLGLAFTGTSSHGILATSGKLLAKRDLHLSGLPTPAWMTPTSDGWQGQRPERAILKAVWEHASFGMGDDAVVDCRRLSDPLIQERLRLRERQSGKAHFAEQFVDGREFNLSLLAGDSDPEVLPPAEIQFIDFPPEKPRIVGYSAKWHEQSAEYRNTPRTFDFAASDNSLLDELRQLAIRCWHQFELGGCGRVDFRVDTTGQPWILEVNTNPCLAPDAGFAAAVQRAGMPYHAAIDRILSDGLQSVPAAKECSD